MHPDELSEWHGGGGGGGGGGWWKNVGRTSIETGEILPKAQSTGTTAENTSQ